MRHTIGTTILALALATALPFGIRGGQASNEPVPEQTGFADVNGIQLFFRVYGEGPPLLLIHGGLSDSRIWHSQIATLSQHHRVIVADSRGQGRSTSTEDTITYDLMAEDYLGLLDALHIDKVALVGWSDGGIIGLDIAIHHPERLSSLFVQAANATPDGALAYNPDDSTRPELKHYDDVVQEIHALWANEPNFTAEELAEIPVPTEIAIGDHDEAISREHTEYMAATIPGARLLILPDVGHSAPVEDPSGYASAVLDFVDGIGS
ncbi:alpha/beta fold hydrolase [Aureimonas sp. ME7]|uniref:alpha/beta fold hydrolase n=1 Tax=Aureimonas sp. ME7 TaxID=2744252 RepID=UPI0015F4FC49|nr:alpha/beta fold hydrolase [Aureimonas sp. ME7]